MDQYFIFDPAAARDYLEDIGRLKNSAVIRRDNARSAVKNCLYRSDSLRESFRTREEQARRTLEELGNQPSEEEAQQQIDHAREELEAARAARQRLDSLWENLYPSVQRLQNRMEEHYDTFDRRRRNGDWELERYNDVLRQIRKFTHGEDFGTSGRTALPIGWCPKNNWFSAVTADSDGKKTVTMTIGGKKQSFSCDKAGTAEAYRMAEESGDAKMIRITSAMFEVESFRRSLCLGPGDPGVPQLGGYHGNVSRQDPSGFESHHIPSKATQNRHVNWLPALSITHADHVLTASHGHKQFRVYSSVFSVNPKLYKDRKIQKKPGSNARRQKMQTYQNEVIRQIRTGETGWLHIMKSEILDLKATTGSKYDGAISAYLDAVQDMLATRGIPVAMPIGKQKGGSGDPAAGNRGTV